MVFNLFYLSLLLLTYIYIFILNINNVNSEILFENDATVDFSGSNFGGSTGWIYSETIDSAIQWGRLYYRMTSIDMSNTNTYVHVTFMAINNGVGTYTSGTTITQQMRVVDSVGSTAFMISQPTQSMHYLLNMDLGGGTELNVDTEYIYEYTSNWTCMEWYTNSNTQEIHLYENSVSAYQVSSSDDITFNHNGGITFSFGSSQDVRIGMYTYNGVAVTGQFKDVVIADERVGCGDGSSIGGSTTNPDDGSGSGSGSGSGANNSDANTTGTGLGHSTSMIIAFVVVLSIILICVGGGFLLDKKLNGNSKTNADNAGGVINSNGQTQTNIVRQHTSQNSSTNVVFSN